MKKYLLVVIIAAMTCLPQFSLADTADAVGDSASYPTKLYRTGQIATYDQNGNRVDFQGTGQDGEYQRGVIWPEPRFFHNGDGTITDYLTGLMWLKDGNCLGQSNWHSAVKIPEKFNASPEEYKCRDYLVSYNDWYLPNLDELESLINAENQIAADYLKLSGFSQIEQQDYWTGSSYINPFNAWMVNMLDGSISFSSKMEKHNVLLVRQIPIALENKNEASKAKDEEDKDDEAKEDEVVPKPFVRFLDNGDGTVSDLNTGLMWLKDAGCFAKMNWQDALSALEKFALTSGSYNCKEYSGSYDDWIMANRGEMKSLIDYSKDYPAIDSKHFLNLSEFYWSSTTFASSPKEAFAVDIFEGSVKGKSKVELAGAWPVRSINTGPARERKTTHSGLGVEVQEKFIIRADPAMPTEIIWPPSPRFFDNGDGTVMDRMTGITWLADANCFGKLTWEDAAMTLKKFNLAPRQYSCKGYEVAFSDWIVPSVEDLLELISRNEKKSNEWLTQQGVSNIQSGGDYWSSSETLVNLYYAYVINFKQGRIRNYPKSLKFFFWPRRSLSLDQEHEPLINITANAVSDSVIIGENDPVSISIYLHTFGNRKKADFWFWYETPDGETIWLSAIRTWNSSVTPIYQGDLFNLKNYEIFRSNNSEKLEKGEYVFHFGVDFNPDGLLDEIIYENQIIVTVE